MTIESQSDLYFDIRDDQWPIIYHKKYNVSFWGIEKLHSFDSKKWGKIIEILKDANLINDDTVVSPNEATKEDLLMVHTKKYLNSLKWSCNVAIISEVPCLALCPNFIVQSHYLKPMRLQTGGSILAGKLALERGWCINVGGGFHHCSSEVGAGFCPYADITLLVHFLRAHKLARKTMIVDLDAHQGNGYQLDFLEARDVYIMDMYNKDIYPKDHVAKQAINRKIELKSKCEDLEYMLKLRSDGMTRGSKSLPYLGIKRAILVEGKRAGSQRLIDNYKCRLYSNLKEALKEFTPDILIYNAGTDILDGDRLGHMFISEYGVIKRDEFMFETCVQKKIPIVMLTSGGYQNVTGRIIAESILNLHNKGLIGKRKTEKSVSFSV